MTSAKRDRSGHSQAGGGQPDAGHRLELALPLWLRIAARFADVTAALWWQGTALPAGSRLLFLEADGTAIDAVRAADAHVDRGVHMPTLPLGTARMAVTAPSPLPQGGARFFPAIKHLVLWRDPFGFRRLAASDPDGRSVKKIAHDFRYLWKETIAADRGGLHRRWSRHFVGDFVAAEPAASDPGPLTFILMPEDRAATPDELARLAAALKAQTDPAWRLIAPISSAGLPREERVRRIEAADPAGFADAALAEAGNGIVVLLSPGAIPTRDAVAMLRDCFGREPNVRFAYTDEASADRRDRLHQCLFKPAWSPRLMEVADYVGDLAAFRSEDALAAGGWRTAPAPLHDLKCRILAGLEEIAIRHIPRVACVTRRPAGLPRLAASPEPPARDDTARDPTPAVSIVIPTRDRADLLSVAIDTLIERTDYPDFQIVVVDNGSAEPETLALFGALRARRPSSVVVQDDGAFNFSRLSNAGIAAASGELICLLNNDIQITNGHWLREIVRAARPERVGIVGARLLYPDGLVQHAGITLGLFDDAVHRFYQAGTDEPGPQERLWLPQNVSAVTGACMLVKRVCLDAIGLLDEAALPVEYSDVDLCLRARKAGYEVVWTPWATLVHNESASRGAARTPERSDRRQGERDFMERRWGMGAFEDPYYSPCLARESFVGAPAFPPRDRAPRSSLLPSAMPRES